MVRQAVAVSRVTAAPGPGVTQAVGMLGGSAVLDSMAAGSATALLIRLLDRRIAPIARPRRSSPRSSHGADSQAERGTRRHRPERRAASSRSVVGVCGCARRPAFVLVARAGGRYLPEPGWRR